MSLFFFKQKTAYEMRISDWSSDVCSSDLVAAMLAQLHAVRDPAPQWRAGRLAAAVRADARDQLLRMRLRIDADGQIWLERPGHQASPMSSNMTAATALVRIPAEIGRASGRERVCTYVLCSVGAGSIEKKQTE